MPNLNDEWLVDWAILSNRFHSQLDESLAEAKAKVEMGALQIMPRDGIQIALHFDAHFSADEFRKVRHAIDVKFVLELE